jgi:hypothetical protein
MNLEEQLRGALRREPAPVDFAARVMARVPVVIWWRRPMTLALAAGLAMAAVIPPAVSEYHRRERERAMEAKAQLVTALAITQFQLRQVSEKIKRNTRHAL